LIGRFVKGLPIAGLLARNECRERTGRLISLYHNTKIPHDAVERTEERMTKKILVVEDEPASLKVLCYFLGHEGYDVVGATDGLEALDLLNQLQFDLVLSDLRMPRMDGVALTRYILARVPATPVLLMTAYDFDDRNLIRESGVPHLTKPLSLDELLRTVQNVLRKSATA
jgi:two-component system response regulator MprA